MDDIRLQRELSDLQLLGTNGQPDRCKPPQGPEQVPIGTRL
jgi:hypothetical protein